MERFIEKVLRKAVHDVEIFYGWTKENRAGEELGGGATGVKKRVGGGRVAPKKK